MKRFLLSLVALVAVFSSKATSVLIAVDMTGQTISANGVHIAGSFQAWDPAATAMTVIPTTQVYYYTYTTTTPGKIEFKFINGNSWNAPAVVESVPASAEVGGGNSNRWYVVDTSMTKDTVLVSFSGTTSSAFVALGYNKKYVRLRVNMAKTATIDPKGVLVAGMFNGWSDRTIMQNLVTSGKVYEAQFWLSAGTYEFKYKNGPSGWESVPTACATNGNRTITVASADVVNAAVCMNECSDCVLNLPKYKVTFNTDVTEEVTCGTVDSVDVTGGNPLLGNWGSPGQKMTKVGATNAYTLQIMGFDSGTAIEYKYRVWSKGVVAWEQVSWTSNGNRALNIVKDTVMATNCFGKNGPCVTPPAASKVTFKVDFAGSGATPGTKVYITGKGNDLWLKGAVSHKLEMTVVAGTSGKVYSVTVDSICPGTLYYTFTNDATDEKLDTLANKACLAPSGIGFQRVYQRPAGASTVYYIFGRCDAGKTGFNASAANESFRMYPNPMSSSTTVELGTGNYTINMLDMTGRVVRTYNNVSGKVTIAKGDLNAGIYFVDVVGENVHHTERLSIR